MLESLFKYAGVLRRMRHGPLAAELDALAENFVRVGYSRATARRYLSLLATFSRYAHKAGYHRPEALDRALVERFLRTIPKCAGTRSLARTAVGHAMRYVARRAPVTSSSPTPNDPEREMLSAFDVYLRDVRGLQPRSRQELVRHARRLLRWYRARRPDQLFAHFAGEDVLAFVADITAKCVADGTRSAAVSHLRGVLRYLHGQGVLHDDLARLVPRVPFWRLATVPSHLTWAQVRAAIDAIDAGTPVGKRDRALLLVLATTGLRSQEVRRLELRDIHWRTGELHIRQTKTRRERVVPLLEEAGRALATYALHGRPPGVSATVFLCHVPPARPIPCSSTVAAIVRRRLADSGLHLPRAGAHLLRHSLATRLVQQTRPIKEVADLLGHCSIDTTALYVKVALPQLEQVALPFPEVST